MAKYSNGLFSALEDRGVPDAYSPVKDAEVIPHDLNETEDDVNSEIAAMESLRISIEDAQDEIGTLESVGDIIESSIENGDGLSASAAKNAEVAIEGISRRLGIRRPVSVIPSIESFGIDRNRHGASQIALEGVREMLGRVWGRVASGLHRLAEKTRGLTDKLNITIGRHKAVVEKFRKEIESNPKYNGKPESITFTDNGLATMFPEDHLDAKKAIEYIRRQTTLETSYDRHLNDFLALAKATKIEVRDGQITVSEVPDKIIKLFDGLSKGVGNKTKDGTTTNIQIGPMVKNGHIEFHIDGSHISVSNRYGGQRSESAEVTTLSKKEMLGILDAALQFWADGSRFKTDELVFAVDREGGRVLKAVTAASNKGTEDTTKAFRETYASAINANFAMVGFVTETQLYLSRGLLNYVSASMRQYRSSPSTE